MHIENVAAQSDGKQYVRLVFIFSGVSLGMLLYGPFGTNCYQALGWDSSLRVGLCLNARFLKGQ